MFLRGMSDTPKQGGGMEKGRLPTGKHLQDGIRSLALTSCKLRKPNSESVGPPIDEGLATTVGKFDFSDRANGFVRWNPKQAFAVDQHIEAVVGHLANVPPDSGKLPI